MNKLGTQIRRRELCLGTLKNFFFNDSLMSGTIFPPYRNFLMVFVAQKFPMAFFSLSVLSLTSVNSAVPSLYLDAIVFQHHLSFPASFTLYFEGLN